ncbi:LysR substrate-binding domain-containing protein [Agrobacterium vitis]|uniref:LysR family transcriptional regulator n=1 Tax=Agrobacterium vitis TaxID=373 RepID=UPI0012E712E6|nr:LysR substrate-binding domain-containing protein [Agrobacterium vitis]MUZ65377.1 LysR family transcriptional regulator [Agrobacterium vitis]
MRRPIKLRQLEAFRAVMDAGTVSRAADTLFISQPAVSKLIAHLEEDTNLQLFDRGQGRLVPTPQGIRLYEELERIYTSVHQVEKAVETIHREQHGHLIVGGSPAMEDFIRQVLLRLIDQHPDAYISMRTQTSRLVTEWLRNRQIDVGIVTGGPEDPSFKASPLLARPLVCLLAKDHPLASKSVIKIEDLDGVPFISSTPNGRTARETKFLFNAYKLRHNIVMDLTTISAVCDFVAAGLGVSLLHPLLIAPYREKLAVRPFEPTTQIDFLICYPLDQKRTSLVSVFVAQAEAVARELEETIDV